MNKNEYDKYPHRQVMPYPDIRFTTEHSVYPGETAGSVYEAKQIAFIKRSTCKAHENNHDGHAEIGQGLQRIIPPVFLVCAFYEQVITQYIRHAGKVFHYAEIFPVAGEPRIERKVHPYNEAQNKRIG